MDWPRAQTRVSHTAGRLFTIWATGKFLFNITSSSNKSALYSQWLSGKESTCQCKRWGFNPWSRKISWRRKWQPTPVFLSGKSQGQRSLAGYSPRDCKESGMTEQLSNNNNYWLQRNGPTRHLSPRSHPETLSLMYPQNQWTNYSPPSPLFCLRLLLILLSRHFHLPCEAGHNAPTPLGARGVQLSCLPSPTPTVSPECEQKLRCFLRAEAWLHPLERCSAQWTTNKGMKGRVKAYKKVQTQMHERMCCLLNLRRHWAKSRLEQVRKGTYRY